MQILSKLIQNLKYFCINEKNISKNVLQTNVQITRLKILSKWALIAEKGSKCLDKQLTQATWLFYYIEIFLVASFYQ